MRNIFLLVIIVVSFSVFSCKSSHDENSKSPNEVIATLKEGVSVSSIEDEFKNFNLLNKKRLGKNLNMYLFTFDTQKISADSLVSALKASANVINAQTNKSVSPRN